MISGSIVDEENRDWLRGRGSSMLLRYLRRNHNRLNYEKVLDLLFWAYPVEGKKLVLNYKKSDAEKKSALIRWIVHQPQITCLILGDQRMGKDALICQIFEEIIQYCKDNKFHSPRFVTLGNVKIPYFVNPKDRYFSWRKIPSGTKFKPVYIYCSEIEKVLSAREHGSGAENKLFNQLEGTLAQNHQKLFGAVKLASKVDLNVIRSCNVKLFKFISPEKLNMEGVERANFLTELGLWLLPKDVMNKSKTLLVFNNNLLTVDYDLPDWWSDDYSEQFRDVSEEDVWDYVDTLMFETDKLTLSQIHTIQTVVFQNFRHELTREQIIKRYSLPAIN